jgi:hypothetical protein
VDLLVEPDLEQVDVKQLLSHGVELLVLDDHRPGLALADLHVDQGGPVGERLAKLAGLHLERHAVAVGTSVEDAGHEAATAQPAGRARAALRSLLDGQRGSAAVGHDGRPV